MRYRNEMAKSGWPRARILGLFGATTILGAGLGLALRDPVIEVQILHWPQVLALVLLVVGASPLLFWVARSYFASRQGPTVPEEEFALALATSLYPRLDARLLLGARAFIPTPLPEGWGAPKAFRGDHDWKIDLGEMHLVVGMEELHGGTCLRVLMIPHGDLFFISEERAATALRHFIGIESWGEFRAAGAHAATRAWRGVPLRPWASAEDAATISRDVPITRAKPRPAHLDTLLRHLPENLPLEWSAPIATDDPDGTWVIDVEGHYMLVRYAREDRTKLEVIFTSPVAAEWRFNEGDLRAALFQFRGVTSFVPMEVDDPRHTRAYVADVRKTEPSARRAPKAAKSAPN